MENEKLKELFEIFLKSYQEEAMNKIWTNQSSVFKKFWDERIMIPTGQELNDQEIDIIIRILDRNGKGNTKESEAVAKIMIPQDVLRKLFKQVKEDKLLAESINSILSSISSEERIKQID